MEDTGKILIAGGGPTGMVLANELTRYGVQSVVFEAMAHDQYAPPPKTNMANSRTMSLLRRLGVADAVRGADLRSKRWVNRVTYATRLNGFRLASFEDPFGTGGAGDFAPEAAEWGVEYAYVYPLRARAHLSPDIDLRHGKRVVSFVQDDDGVVADVLDVATGEVEQVRGSYLIGCDGSQSTVRKTLGVRLVGSSGLRNCAALWIKAPELSKLVSVGDAMFYWITNPESCPLMVPFDQDRWQVHFVPLPEGADAADPAALKDLVSKAAGRPVEVEILNGGPWVLHSVLADDFRHGRAFLVGDAAHLVPPLGGFGMNLGVLDAVDLAWKLAGTVNEWGGEKLLDGYSTERHFSDRWVMDVLEENARVLGTELVQPDMESDDERGRAVREQLAAAIVAEKTQEFESFFAQFGYHYAQSPLVVPDGTEPQAKSARVYVPSATPGCLAPHAWLADGSSLYDLFGTGFTLLRLGRNADDQPLRDAADAVGLPLTVLTVDEPRVRELYGADLALIRPDQHVAWRGSELPADVAGLVDTVRGA